jgi:DNA-binding LacI/PurR family transcriptional regulator
MARPKKQQSGTTLKSVAQHLGLTAGTVSAVLNDSPAAQAIPQRTKDRILAAARELNYRPNYFARSLRKKRTYTVGVIAEEIGDAYSSIVISGVEKYLRDRDYFFLTVAHRHDPILLSRYEGILLERGVEGFITVDTSLIDAPVVPTVAVAGHRQLQNVTNIILDHDHCAYVALSHLKSLGHRTIAFMRGHPNSSDSSGRWEAINKISRELGIEVDSDLVVQITSLDSTSQLGYPFGKELLARKKPFTALFAYNDISALGAIRAFQEEGLRVPEDVSVVGVDDIPGAAFHTPSLTTVRQPLEKMGWIAAETLIARIEDEKQFPPDIAIEPELVVRNSTRGIATAIAV